MKKWTAFCAGILITILAVHPGAAQFKDQGLGAGASFGGTFGLTELRDKKIEHYARGFIRYGMTEILQGEFGIGAGFVKGEQYKTQIFPIDYRILLSPISSDRLNPYLYAGIGVLRFDIEVPPPVPTRGEKISGWTAFVPAGVGIQYLLTNNVAVEFTGGYNHTFKDNLNGIVKDENDAYVTFTGGLTVVGESGSADADGDGLTNGEEKQLGTDKMNPDTDGDGLSDGDEINRYKTNPLMADSDGDGLDDGTEVNKEQTDPNKPDTDGDGLNDGDEVNVHKTDPRKADTDGDGLSDGNEVLTTKTNPLKADTDGDGLTDSDEVNRHKTDPLNVDTDGGTVSDGVEVKRGTNPLLASDDVKEEIKVEVGKKIVLEGIVFETGKATISAESESILEKAYNTLFQNPDLTVEIHGYTDNVGNRSSNLKLSEARAEAVKEHLVSRGIAADRMVTKGFGPDDPIAPNTTPDGRQKNRRIEFLRVK